MSELWDIANVKICDDIMSPVTGSTPKRKVEEYYNKNHGNLLDPVVKRRHMCEGNPVGIPKVRKERNRNCQVCQKRTATISCLGCHGVFCSLNKPHMEEGVQLMPSLFQKMW